MMYPSYSIIVYDGYIIVYDVSIVSKSDGKHSSYLAKRSDVNPIKNLYCKVKSSYFVWCINRLRCKQKPSLGLICTHLKFRTKATLDKRSMPLFCLNDCFTFWSLFKVRHIMGALIMTLCSELLIRLSYYTHLGCGKHFCLTWESNPGPSVC